MPNTPETTPIDELDDLLSKALVQVLPILRTGKKYRTGKEMFRPGRLPWEVQEELKAEINALINQKVTEARIEEARIVHKKIDMRFNLIGRIQTAYKGSKTINVNELQDLLCDHQDRLAALKAQQQEKPQLPPQKDLDPDIQKLVKDNLEELL